MIQRARMQPHTPRAQRPGVAHCVGQQMFPEATSELPVDDPEIRDLYRIVLGHAAQLVPPGEIGLIPSGAAGRHKKLNGGGGGEASCTLARTLPRGKPPTT